MSATILGWNLWVANLSVSSVNDIAAGLDFANSVGNIYGDI